MKKLTVIASLALAVAGVTLVPSTAHAAEGFGCTAFAGPSGGPTIVGKTLSGTGKGNCTGPWFMGVTVEIDVRRNPNSRWESIGSASTLTANTPVNDTAGCRSGLWQYRTHTVLSTMVIEMHGVLLTLTPKQLIANTTPHWIAC